MIGPGVDIRRWIRAVAAAVVVAFAQGIAFAAPPAPVQVNPFHDPFEQVTHGLPGCPAPRPPTYTASELREAEHRRVERGNSCYLAGKCRYSNSFLYDSGIAAALAPALRADPWLRGTSVWILVQGRFVQVFGCVSRPGQIRRLEAAARRTRDVQAVLPIVMQGTTGKPPYATTAP